MTTIFDKIIAGEIPADIVHEDEISLAFRDINPQAPVHVLIIPKKPIATINDIAVADRELVGHLYIVAAKLAQQFGIAESGYRVVMNCNVDGGQSVYHIHLHLLGGITMGWPPFANQQPKVS
jgi:histidine triad (HIT) family protein